MSFCETVLLIRLSISAKIVTDGILTFEQLNNALTAFLFCLQNWLADPGTGEKGVQGWSLYIFINM